MGGDRLRATDHCRVLTQKELLGAFRFFIVCIPFSTLSRPVDSLYCSRAGMFLGVKFASAPLPGASATCSSCWA